MWMRRVKASLVGLAAAAGLLVATATATATPTAAAAATGSIHPGVQTRTNGAQCTANFVFTDGTSTYIGQAAHCAGTGGSSATNGCTSASLPLGTPVAVGGADQPGTLVYSSWLAMQASGETDPDTCQYNDLALVRLAPSDVADVDPTVPGFGGPTGVGAAPSNLLDTVFSYGDSELRMGITQLNPKQGLVLQTEGNGWSRNVLTITPGIPGDSGSGFLNASGQAIGVLSTLELAPLPASNGVGDLSRELAYLNAQPGFAGVRLVPGTRPFTGNLLGAILGL
jgi:hypothetical protein